MIYMKLLLVLLSLFSVCIGTTRVNYQRCNYNGFTCVTSQNKKRILIYTCTSEVNDILIYINIMDAPSDMERLVIRNCERVALSTRCSGENKFMSYLGVTNVTYLTFPRYQYEPMLPPIVHLENIKYIDAIPYHTFAQVEKPYYSWGCSVPKSDLESITMKNVEIGEIQSGAIVATTNFKNITFVNVKIRRLQTSGIKLKLDVPGEFRFQNSSIDHVEHVGFQLINTRRVTFSGNSFTELSSSAINGTMDEFYFVNNIVETAQAYSFSLLATNVFMINNTFIQMKSAALEKISPGLIQDSGRNFGQLKFIYDFSKNVINFVDVAGLHPDYVSYENVQTEMVFRKNKLFCSCDNIGWLFSELGHGPNSLQVKSFYDKVVDEKYLNTCVGNCDMPLKVFKRFVVNGKCMIDTRIQTICSPRKEKNIKTTQSEVALPEVLKSNAVKGNISMEYKKQPTTEHYLLSSGLKLFQPTIMYLVILVQMSSFFILNVQI